MRATAPLHRARRLAAVALALTWVWTAAASCTDAPAASRDAASDAPDADAAIPDSDAAPPPPPACTTQVGPAVDLVRRARLHASATRAPLVPPWPREDRDAIATVRDDDPTTGWRVPVDRPAVVTLDLAPLLGHALSLDRLELDFATPAPATVEARLFASCGGAPVGAARVLPPDGVLPLDGVCAACIELTVVAAEATTLNAIRLLSRDAAIPAEPPEPAPAATTDRGAGVVEGFYGVPWSFAERRRMLATLAHLGLGTCLYAPKEDPLHRARWREPYPAEFVSALGELASYGASLGVDVVFGISPFLDLDPDDAADLAALDGKLGSLAAAGLRHFAILADDIEVDATLEVDAALGEAQVATVLHALGALRASWPDATLRFVPTVYSDQRRLSFPDGDGYLEALAELPADVPWLWTGPDTGNATLEPADLEAAIALVGRPPMIWDNLWANDGGDGFFGRVLLGAYAGRAPGLRAATDGIVQNPLMQGGLARLVVGTFGAALAGVADSELRARAAQVEALRSPDTAVADEALLLAVMRTFDAVHDQDPGHHAFERAVADLAAALQGGAPVDLAAAMAAALPLLVELATLETRAWHSGLATELVDELDFPLDKPRAEAERALAALSLLAARGSGLPTAAAEGALAEAEERSSKSRFVFSPGATDPLADRARDAAAPSPLTALAPLDPPTLPCQSGEAFVFQPALGPGAHLAAAGPPGLRVEGSTLRFTPRHAGRFVVHIAAWSDAPVAFAEGRFTVVCEEAP
ncbi:MAG: beta-N-acetylglucosaminidase domain-containing protein [Deltaproteobacteria bacterium]|nr:beta-N-acetylglucosaminidase domain-containing protein [Deltaproteobacteria bacterium]